MEARDYDELANQHTHTRHRARAQREWPVPTRKREGVRPGRSALRTHTHMHARKHGTAHQRETSHTRASARTTQRNGVTAYA